MKKPKSFEAFYPTKHAREVADKVFDALPLDTSLGEACCIWEYEYLKAGGLVRNAGG